MQRKYNSNNRLKYANGDFVDPNAKTRSEGTGSARKHFVINQDDGSETQVYTATVLSKSRLKYANGKLVPSNVQTRSEGKGKTRKHFVINQDGSETQVYTAITLGHSRLKYADGELVHPNAQTRSEGTGNAKKHFVIKDGSETQVYTAITLSQNRLKYANGDLVPPNAKTRSEGKRKTSKHFVIHPDGSETQVYTANALSKRKNKLIDLPIQKRQRLNPSNDVSTAGKNELNHGIPLTEEIRLMMVDSIFKALDRVEFESTQDNLNHEGGGQQTAKQIQTQQNLVVQQPSFTPKTFTQDNLIDLPNPGRVSTHPSSLFGQSSQTNPYQFSSQPSSFVFGHSGNQSILPTQEQIENSHLNTEESNSNVTVINSPNGNGNNDFYQKPLTSHQLLFGDRIQQTVFLEEQEFGRAKLPF